MKEIKATFLSQSVEPDASEVVPVKVAGVYCDLSAYVAAAHQLQSLANRCNSICRFDSTWWSFESLAAPEMREAAAHAAAAANLVWCSACACEPLPDTVKAWLEDWSAQERKVDTALVAMLRCPLAGDFEHSPTRLCLCAVARASAMELFERKLVCDCPQQHSSLTKTEIPLQLVNQPEGQAHRGWGINE